MRESRARARRNDIIKSVALIGTIALVFLALPPVFKAVDCNTAKKNLTFIERCIENEVCTLTQKELQRFEGYVRLEIKSCARED